MLTETFLRYGQSEPPAEFLPLQAGPLTLLYDSTSGMIRCVKLGDTEVLRGIYAAVRDRNWGTVPAASHEVSHTIDPSSFHIEFVSEHRQDNIHFVWRGNIRGDDTGTIRYEFDGEAKTTFLRNRIGFCVLHPIRECAGARAQQLRVDGTEIDSHFPDLIEPQIIGQSSFRDLRAVTHEIAPGISARVKFEGDTFEMEDQRNWTDASFKTYCTPLSLPFPIEVQAGTRIRQSVTLKILGNVPTPTPRPVVIHSQPEVIDLQFPSAPTCRLPALGLGSASDGLPLSESEINTLHPLRLAHIRLDVRLADANATEKLRRAVRDAVKLDARLELALFLPQAGEINPQAILEVLSENDVSLARILALREGEPATSIATMDWTRKHFASLGAPIGAGSDCNFCELNRELSLGRTESKSADFLFWSINPQVHAFDHLSIMETLEAQTATVASARSFAAGKPLVISPATLKPRFNPVATSAEIVRPDELPAPVDPRQLSHFAAAWTLGSIAALATAGAHSVTFYETAGWRGVIERTSGSPLPDKFPSQPGSSFSVLNVFAHLAGFEQAAPALSSHPQTVSALGLFTEGMLRRILVANLSTTSRTIAFHRPTGPRSELKLQPYDVTRVDLPV